MDNDYYLRKWADPALKKVCTPVTDFSDLDALVSAMERIMYGGGYVGLAAPQVGDNRRVIIAKLNNSNRILINPEITNAKGYQPFLEGCASLPGIPILKLRKYSIDIAYQDINGTFKQETYKGISSVILQHEIDHLEGILITDIFPKRKNTTNNAHKNNDKYSSILNG